jgi:hypothetical protein
MITLSEASAAIQIDDEIEIHKQRRMLQFVATWLPDL